MKRYFVLVIPAVVVGCLGDRPPAGGASVATCHDRHLEPCACPERGGWTQVRVCEDDGSVDVAATAGKAPVVVARSSVTERNASKG